MTTHAIVPRNDEVRLLRSWRGEHSSRTRLMHSGLSGDGAMHLMMHHEDRLASRFSGVKAVHQHS